MPSFIIYQEANDFEKISERNQDFNFIGFNVRNLTYNGDVDLFLERSLGQFELWFKDRKDTPAD